MFPTEKLGFQVNSDVINNNHVSKICFQVNFYHFDDQSTLSHQHDNVTNIPVAENDRNKPVNGINIIPTTIITIDENIISEANWRSLKGAFRSVARARTIRTIATKNSSCTFLLQKRCTLMADTL